jgi:hypothetical protein
MSANRFPLSTDTPTVQQFNGQLGGAANVWQAADAALTRPNNTTAYAANGALGSASSAVFRFGAFFRVAGSSGLLTGARLIASVTGIATSNMGSITVHLFNASPAAAIAAAAGGLLADQSTFNTMLADDSAKLGTISFSTWAIGGGTSNLIESYGSPALAPLPIMAARGAQELYAVPVATAAFTPAALQEIQLYLAAVLD